MKSHNTLTQPKVDDIKNAGLCDPDRLANRDFEHNLKQISQTEVRRIQCGRCGRDGGLPIGRGQQSNEIANTALGLMA